MADSTSFEKTIEFEKAYYTNNIYHMASIKRFDQYFSEESLERYFVDCIMSVKEEKESSGEKADEYKNAFEKICKDLNMNSRLIVTFGFGIGGFYPIVESLMRLEGFNLNTRSVVLLTLAAISILVIGDDKKSDSAEKSEKDLMIEDVNKKVLQELNQTVSPNSSTGDSPALKKAIFIIRSFYEGFWKKAFSGTLRKTIEPVGTKIKSAWSSLGRGFGRVAGSMVDMLAYTSMLIPVMNVIDSAINNFPDLFATARILPQNFAAFAAGVGAIVAKHGVAKLVSKFANPENEEEIEAEIETPLIQRIAKVGDMDGAQEAPMIKEEP